MAEVLFITPTQMTQSTILSGNIDIDKYLYCIESVQMSVIEPLLGTILYDKMIADFAKPITYTGLYLILYNDFIVPITRNQSVGEFLEVASYTVDNGGIYKHTAGEKEVVSKNEAEFLASKYKNLAQLYITRFEKWVVYNTIVEYQTYNTEVNADRNLDVSDGWYFSGTNNKYRNDSGDI